MSDTSSPLVACSPEVNAIVSASAGTGKTYLLVTRIIRLLLAGAPAERILALTFTRKAAGEMRQRLHERLRDLATLDDEGLKLGLVSMDVTPDPAHMDRARRLYERMLLSPRPLRISTFHAFCQQLLQRFPLEADVPPGYELLQTGGLVQTAAWDALFLDATRDPDGPLACALETLFIACGGSLDNVHSALTGLLGRRNDWLAYTQDRENPVDYACAKLRQLLRLDTAEPLPVFFTGAGADLSRFRELLLKHVTDTNLRHAALIETGLDAGNDFESRFECIKGAFLTRDLEPRQRKNSKALEKSMGTDRAAEFLQLHDSLCQRILATHEAMLRREYWQTSAAWYRAGDALLSHYQRIKQEQRLLDFDDLEWKSYRLLHHREHALWVQYKIDQKIDHLLIDEFQDTNPTQWRLLLPLLEEMADSAGRERGRSVFLVGDGKQSIYGFRRADPRLQEAAGNWLQQRMAAREFALQKSRRSADAVMHTINHVFQDTSLGARLDGFQPHATHRGELWGWVEILPRVEPPPRADNTLEHQGLRDPLTTPRTATETELRYVEGLEIARRIREIIEGAYIVEKSDGGMAPVDYDDIFILFRARTHIAAYEQALTVHAIPFASLEKGTLLEQQEVEDIEALLNVLLTPFNNLALAQVLKSPIFGADDTDLIRLSALPGDWYGRLQAHAEDTATADRSPALLRAWRLLAAWRKLLPTLPLHDLLDRIYHEGDLIARYRSATPPPLVNRVTSNLQRLLALALEIDSGRYPSLSNFLLQLKRIRASDQDQPDTPPLAAGERKVRLMTIHAAKGLEAPVVFLADACSGGSRHDSFHTLVDWPHTDDKPEHFLLYTTKARLPAVLEPVLERQQRRQLREQANLLYVALTRAKQMLFVSGSGKGEIPPEDWYGSVAQALQPRAESLPGGGYRLCSGELRLEAQPRPAGTIIGSIRTPETALSRFEPAASAITPGSAATGDETARGIPPEQQLFSRRHGTILHKMLEMMTPPEPVAAPELDVFLDYGIKREDLANWRAEAQAVLATPELRFLFDPQLYDKAYKEVPLAYRTADGKTVYGVIDRVVLRNDEVWVIDYKTRPADDARTPQELAQYYRAQLRYYVEGLRKIWPGKNMRPAILLTGSRTLLEVE
jgi:ATP-dependent helicase/nuclease subunit A